MNDRFKRAAQFHRQHSRANPYDSQEKENALAHPMAYGNEDRRIGYEAHARDVYGGRESSIPVTTNCEDHIYYEATPLSRHERLPLPTAPRFIEERKIRNEHSPTLSLTEDLLQSISNGSLNSVKASILLWQSYEKGMYNPVDYEMFINNSKIRTVSRFDFGESLFPPEINNHPHASQIYRLQQKIQNDVNLALNSLAASSVKQQNERIAREFDIRHSKEFSFNVGLLTDELLIVADETFQEINVGELLRHKWSIPAESHNPIEKLFGAFKFILAQLTRNPADITQYTHTFSGSKGKKYKKLPDEIIMVLRATALQLTGLNEQYLDVSEEMAKEKYPLKWVNLGSDDVLRSAKLLSSKNSKNRLLGGINKLIVDAMCELRRCDFTDIGPTGTRLPKRKRELPLVA